MSASSKKKLNLSFNLQVFGVTLSLWNKWHNRKIAEIFLEFIPQLIFLVFIFCYLIFLIFFTPITALIYLIVKGRGMAERNMKAAQRMQEQQAEYIRSVSGGGADPAEQIAKAKGLLDSGAITQAEFDSIKAKALA